MSPREKAAVLWAEHVTRNTAKTRDDVFQEVRRHYDDREFVELTMVITYFNMRNRFQDALRIPLDEPKTISGITLRAQAGPRKLENLSRRGGGGLGPRVFRGRRRETLKRGERGKGICPSAERVDKKRKIYENVCCFLTTSP